MTCKRSQDFLKAKQHVHWTDLSIRLDKHKSYFVVRKGRTERGGAYRAYIYTAKSYFSSFWNMRVCIWSDCGFVLRRKGQKTRYIYNADYVIFLRISIGGGKLNKSCYLWHNNPLCFRFQPLKSEYGEKLFLTFLIIEYNTDTCTQ